MNTPRDYTWAPEEPELLAYADGRLDTDTAKGRAIAAWLERHPAAKQRVQDYRRQDEAIRWHYAPLHAAVIPPHLQIAAIRQRQGLQGSRWLAVVAVSCFAALALSWSVSLNRAPHDLDRFAQRVALQMQAGIEWDLQPPDEPSGVMHDFIPREFRLVGERRVTSGRDALTEFVYASGEDRTLRLFVGKRQPDARDAPEWLHDDGQSLVYWERGRRLYALSGNLGEIELESMALQSIFGAPGVLQVADDPLPAPTVDESQAVLPPAVIYPENSATQ